MSAQPFREKFLIPVLVFVEPGVIIGGAVTVSVCGSPARPGPSALAPQP